MVDSLLFVDKIEGRDKTCAAPCCFKRSTCAPKANTLSMLPNSKALWVVLIVEPFASICVLWLPFKKPSSSCERESAGAPALAANEKRPFEVIEPPFSPYLIPMFSAKLVFTSIIFA